MDNQKIVHPDNPYVQPVNARTGKVRRAWFSKDGIQLRTAVVFWILLIFVLAVAFLVNAADIPNQKDKDRVIQNIASLQAEIPVLQQELNEVTDINYFGPKAAEMGMEQPDDKSIITLKALSPRP